MLINSGWSSGTARAPKTLPASPTATVQREPGEWTLPELSYELAMPSVTLYRWLKQGKLKARQGIGNGHPVWLVQADADELARLRSWRDGSRPHP